MSHYARINQNNIVTYVTPIPNEMITDENGVEHEEKALEHLYSTIPDSVNDRWIQTSYNNNFRNKFAGIGDIWMEDLDIFISPKPYESWIFNQETLTWESPIPMPKIVENGPDYVWDEDIVNWRPIY